jgi:undecaprenyl-diphosphatase
MNGIRQATNSLMQALGWLRRQNALALGGFSAAALLILGFLHIADEVMEGETHGIDKAIMLALRMPGDHANPIGPKWVETTMIELTSFGDNAVLIVVVLSVSIYLWLAGQRLLAGLALGAATGGTILSIFLKSFFDRPRPDFVAHIVYVSSASFPSGHAMLSAVVYLTLGGMMAAAQKSQALKAFVIGLALALTLTVGFTRVYLGVHYPTDVLAGWALGAAWALACMMLVYGLKAKKTPGVEPT